MDYDVIGDIHGHATALHGLLRKLGYRHTAGAWRHPERMAVFVGDLIDRGPEQLETLTTVRDMVDHGSALAVMGNHEFNAIAWSLPDPKQPGRYMRAHNARNEAQHTAFLQATAERPRERDDWTKWFLTLPLWLDLPELRVVHACWHPQSMAILRPLLHSGERLDVTGVEMASRRDSAAFKAVATILKGPEVRLPDGVSFPQGDQQRHEARTRWWDKTATTLRQSAIVDTSTVANLPDAPIPSELRMGYDGSKPVFIGHYWMTGQPQRLSPRVACVDYSAGRGQPLVAYGWRGEEELRREHFVSS